jgi:CheY-like chemotaxis protein/anti-sigma regulatory factor (Ser/Thr protein kinase)
MLSFAMPPPSVIVDGDPLRLSQVFSNLLTNNAKYTQPGGQIALDIEVSRDRIAVTVSDTGAGIEPGELAHIFDIFAHGEGPSARTTDGLGLALVRSIVELHGGEVSATSEGRGKASRFTVVLPRATAQPDAELETSTQALATAQSQCRVLVVDDNADVAQTLAMLLQVFGHDVRIATSGMEALRETEQFRPDVTVLDIGMPDLDGYEVARRLRATSWGREMSLFAATGWGQEKDKALAREAGFDAHLTKPLEAAKLQALIGQHVTQRKPM